MHHNYGVISESHVCKECGWLTILDAELHTTCPGERVLVVIRFNVTFLHLNLKRYEEITKTVGYLFLERCRKSPNVCLRALMQSDCIRPYSLNTAVAFYSANE